MGDRPIIFSGPMVKALRSGTKSQTRRLLNPRARITREFLEFSDSYILDPGNADWLKRCHGYEVGDSLWVREAMAYVGASDPGFLLYRADDYLAQCKRYGFDKPYPPESVVRWKPSIHMPRSASRMTLSLTDVRVQRLQDVCEKDAIAEGVNPSAGYAGAEPHVAAFSDLWRDLHGPLSWSDNPWVVALSFEVTLSTPQARENDR